MPPCVLHGTMSGSPHVYFNISIAINSVIGLWSQTCNSFLGVFPTLSGPSVGFAEWLPVSPFPGRRHTSAGSEWWDATWQRRRFGAPSSYMHLAEALENFIGTFRSKSVSGRRRGNPLWMQLQLYSRLTLDTFFFLGCFLFLPSAYWRSSSSSSSPTVLK